MSCQNCSALQAKIYELEKRLRNLEALEMDESVIHKVPVSGYGAKVTGDTMLLVSPFEDLDKNKSYCIEELLKDEDSIQEATQPLSPGYLKSEESKVGYEK